MSNRILATAVLFVFSVCTAIAADDGPFVSIPFEEACTRAEKESKLVFIDFYTTWCAPCKVMDQTTFVDESVVSWLKEHTIALKIDAEEKVELAAKYSIDSYPTLLFAKPDGSEMGRITGMMEAEEFLKESSAIKAGKSPLERAKQKLAQANENDPMARMDYARELARMGNHEEALKEFLWCFDEGNKHMLGYSGVRTSYLLTDIARLGREYPPALDALRERRDAAEKRVFSQKPEQSSIWSFFKRPDRPVLDYASLNRALDEEEKTLALYDKLREEQPDSPSLEMLRSRVFDLLRKEKRYAEIMESTDIDEEVEQTIARSNRSTSHLPEELREQLEQAQHRMMLRGVAEYYEVLIGVKEHDRAERLAARVLELDDSAETYNLLAWHGYLTGQPTEANLAQARKAHDLSEGKEAAIIDTLARVLHARGKKDEACEVLRTSGKNVTSQGDRMALLETMADLECQDTLIE